MKGKRFLFVPAVLVPAIFVAACAAGPRVVESHADYRHFATAEELVAEAELIIHGTVESTRVEEVPRYGSTEGDPARNPQAGLSEEELGDLQGFVVTIAVVRVNETIKGDVAPGDVVEVLQMGGLYDGVLHREHGTTMLSADEKHGYVLFLNNYGGSSYQLPNPQQAMFKVSAESALTPVGDESSLSIRSLSELKDLTSTIPD